MRKSVVLGVLATIALVVPGSGPVTAADTDGPSAAARVATTVDDRALARSGSWSNKSFAGAHAGTLSKSKDKGATLTSAATTGGGKVVLQFGPGRGKVDVRVAGVKRKTIDTAATKKKLKTIAFPGDGPVVLKVKKPGKGVYVDALVLTAGPTPSSEPPAPVAGQVIITEWLSNPDSVPEASGEWFELHNVSAVTLTLTGCTVSSQAAGSVTLPAATLAAGASYLVARSSDTATNGGLTPNAMFTFNLTTNGSLTLACGATSVDGVTWTGETSGQSTSLDPDFYTASGNDVAANYCVGSVPYGTGGDLGTPGGLNTQCGSPPSPPAPNVGQVIVTEVMANPSAVGDTNGEWFELHNVSGGVLSLTGCTVTRQDAMQVTLSTASIAAGGSFVLARNADAAANGGVTANATFAFGLLDSGSLTLACGPTIDSVTWSTATAGKSRSLSAVRYNAVENDFQAQWCDATLPYGLGDLGTPGTLNATCA